jgi:hypothetical protein
MTDKEKLPNYINQLIDNGTRKITELSEFETKISIQHAEKIREFQIQELTKISNCRTAILLFFLHENELMKSLNERLDEYQKKVQYFPSKFPVEQ